MKGFWWRVALLSVVAVTLLLLAGALTGSVIGK